jgi:methylthioribose-1-phosphate isomerase
MRGSRVASRGQARRPIRRFDVTPARLVTGIITERGVRGANAAALKKLSPEK